MPTSAERAIRRGPRILVALALLLAMGGLYGVLVTQLSSATAADAEFVAAERRGVAYLQPVTRLLAELTSVQSAAVRGATVDALPLNAAVAAVSAIDRQHGAALRTTRRWDDLRAAIAQVLAEHPTGQVALARYGDVVALTNELARTVGDTSALILDPELASSYLLDAALIRLPTVLTATGLAADHTFLAAGGGDGAHPDETILEVAVARHEVASAAQAIGAGLRKTSATTASSDLGPNLTAPLDVFRAATDELAAPAALRQAPPTLGVNAVSTVAERIREATLPLATAVLSELDALLAARQEGLDTRQSYSLATAAAGVLLGVVLLWWSVPPTRLRGQGATEDLSAPDGMGDVASVTVSMPAVDARDLLAIEELVHVGRGVVARPKDEAENAR